MKLSWSIFSALIAVIFSVNASNAEEKSNFSIGLVAVAGGAVKLMRTSIGLLAQPKSIRSIIDASQREQQHGSA